MSIRRQLMRRWPPRYTRTLFHEYERQTARDGLERKGDISKPVIKPKITLTEMPGEQLVTLGLMETSLDFLHQTGAYATILKVRMDDKLSYVTSPLVHEPSD